MRKQILAMVLSLLMLVAVLPVAASAETEQELCKRIETDYQSALAATGKPTLGGYCGLLASWQLYFAGVNEYVISKDGNQQYDTYCNLETTTGGCRTKAYSAAEYTLEQALNAATKNGSKDVYNIIVGFQWTNTEAGASYGHAVFVYAILDGIVYFTEGFATSMGTSEGQAIKATIPQFVKYYDDWTVFDGIVVFGERGYENSCKRYPSDIYVEATASEPVMSQPCTEECQETQSRFLRQVMQGERLLVTGLIENTLGQYYYRVDDCGTVGYIAAQAAMPLRFNYEQISLEEFSAPQVLEAGEDFDAAGVVTAKQGTLGGICMEVTDVNDRVILHYAQESERSLFDLSNKTFNTAVDFSVLEKGYYTYHLYADGINYYVHDGKLIADFQEISLLSQSFKVGKNLPDYTKTATAQPEKRQIRNGWYFEQGNWYYYEQGEPGSGWLTYKGVDYYLQPDGSITTGFAEIDNSLYFFTGTGVKRTGWLDTERDTYYLLPGGEAARGWQTIDGKQYFFGPDGQMLRACWFSQGKGSYYLLADGSAAVGWLELPEGEYYFHADGTLRVRDGETDPYWIQPEYA